MHTVLFFPESGLTIPFEITREYSLVAPYASPCTLDKTVSISQKQQVATPEQAGLQSLASCSFFSHESRIFVYLFVYWLI
jgi:hypothetical protein